MLASWRLRLISRYRVIIVSQRHLDENEYYVSLFGEAHAIRWALTQGWSRRHSGGAQVSALNLGCSRFQDLRMFRQVVLGSGAEAVLLGCRRPAVPVLARVGPFEWPASSSVLAGSWLVSQPRRRGDWLFSGTCPQNIPA
jgi:hypothetical protein